MYKDNQSLVEFVVIGLLNYVISILKIFIETKYREQHFKKYPFYE